MLPPSSLKLLYDSFIQPHIHYGLAIWGSCSCQSKQRIISIQKRAIRTITKSYYSSHTEPRMKKIGLLKFDDLYRQCLVLTHNCVYNKAPSPIQQLVNKKQDSSRIILRNQVNNPLDLKVPNLKTRVGTHSYSVMGPIFWNETPNVQKTIDKRETFKKVIKRCLLNSYSSHSTCQTQMCRDHQHHQ
jgi:hypothetical protein